MRSDRKKPSQLHEKGEILGGKDFPVIDLTAVFTFFVFLLS